MEVLVIKKIVCKKCGRVHERGIVCNKGYREVKRKVKLTYEQKNRNEDTKKYNQFYTSSSWIKTRKRVLIDNSYQCQVCMFNQATQVHHINYISTIEGWEARLDVDNLLCVCDKCHKEIHKHKIKKNNLENFIKQYREFLKRDRKIAPLY